MGILFGNRRKRNSLLTEVNFTLERVSNFTELFKGEPIDHHVLFATFKAPIATKGLSSLEDKTTSGSHIHHQREVVAVLINITNPASSARKNDILQRENTD